MLAELKALAANSVGIVPAGALGVSLFYHLTAQLTARSVSVQFLEQPDSKSSASFRAAGTLRIQDGAGLHTLPVGELFQTDLLTLHEAGRVPEILLLCPNPDQLLNLLTPCVQLLEREWTISQEHGQPLEAGALPILVLCSNGIYFQRIRQVFLEKLEEATLLGRLPDLWPDLMPKIIGRLLRGVTIQTGIREGEGGNAMYRPGPRGSTRVAGGDPVVRARAVEVLTERGGWFENAGVTSPTRVEFDKAMVNLVANLLGQLAAVGSDGRFRTLTLKQVLENTPRAEIETLAQRVMEVGKAVKAYGPHETFTPLFEALLVNLGQHSAHIPSSLQWLELQIRSGHPPKDLTPTEKWLLDPLLHYARSAGLTEAVTYFEGLKLRLQRAIANLV